MRIEKLADNKVKVTFTEADLSHMDISLEELTPNSSELHTFLFHVMETIREETGFNPYNGQVVVEATPQKGGISILISKFSETRRAPAGKKIKSVKARSAESRNKYSLYYFDDFEEMCEALVRIPEETHEKSGLFTLGGRYCYMMSKPVALDTAACVLSEYASEINFFDAYPSHITEHWRLVAVYDGLVSMVEGIAELNRE